MLGDPGITRSGTGELNLDVPTLSLNGSGFTFLKTVLGPTYGSPLEKILVLPATEEDDLQSRYLAYITKDKVGLQILPVDGNPHKSSAFICHPAGVSNLACSYDGRHLFTAGGEDLTVMKWDVNLDALEAAVFLGGEDLTPFYNLLEGGRTGEFFRELEDYFYYAQLCHQGIDTMEPRKVSTHIPLEQVPFVMQAMGFYPSEEQIEDMLNEVKFSEYLDTGKQVTHINLGDFIKLYVNHRPAFGLAAREIQNAFRVLGYKNESHELALDREELLLLLQHRGEHFTEEELAEHLTTLLGLNPEGGRLEVGAYDPTGTRWLYWSRFLGACGPPPRSPPPPHCIVSQKRASGQVTSRWGGNGEGR
uniref:WD repeat domain 66 n=1 Tax=Varanus komodoensis TaxID=61221 RepID=A0A8D2LLY9_VARKO